MLSVEDDLLLERKRKCVPVLACDWCKKIIKTADITGQTFWWSGQFTLKL